ncbi:MAG: F0F1 ATP synthase subunit delta [Ramlibacter sp.]|nr:F0F1 ATP synthase subunit delta [Ramlibacter sp.]
MLIDWFTVAAQALNFVILAWLMKRFLYKPILDAIDAREKRIATELAAAGRKKTEAQHERDEFQKKNDDFEKQRVALMEKARSDADAERQTLIDAARQAADALTAKRQASIAGEAKALVKELRQRAQTEVFDIARKALTDLAGTSLEASACELFIARLQALEGAPKDALATALSGAKDDVVVRSAFELSTAQQRAIHKAIADTFGVKLNLHYATDPAVVAGIELVAQGQKFAWTLSDYLASLERGVRDLLKERSRDSSASPALAADPSATHEPATATAQAAPTSPADEPVAVAVSK